MSSDGDVFLHDAEMIEPTEQKTTAVCPQIKVHLFTCEPTNTQIQFRLSDSTSCHNLYDKTPKSSPQLGKKPIFMWQYSRTTCSCPSECKHSPVEVILHVLSEVNIQHDEVMQVTARERACGSLRRQTTAPFPQATHGIQRELRSGLHVL